MMDVFNAKKLIRSKSGLRIVATNEEFTSPFVVQEPIWVPDKEITHCTHCMVRFGFTTRKHHCRRCGKIFCSCCCETKMELQRMCFIDPVRICLKCEPQTRAENLFFDKHLKLLLNGAVFKYESKIGASNYQLLHCKLSQDHRYLLFDGVKIAPVDINQIVSIDIKKDELNDRATSLIMDYLVGDEKKSLKLDIACGAQVEKAGINWLTAIEQAFRLINHSGKQEKSDD